MSMLLHKSCRPFSRSTSNSRIRHLRGTWQTLSPPPPPLTTPWLLSPSPPLKRLHGPSPFHLSAAAAAHTLLYPMLSCYSTLAIQSMPPSQQPNETTTTTLSTQQQQAPLWLNDTRLQLKKIQHWIESGKHDQALQQASTLPYHDDLLTNTSLYSELLDPYAMLLERRLTQGEWAQGLAEFGQLTRIPGWGTLLQYNRRAIKATLVMHMAQGNTTNCESMLKHLHIKMTATTVARMVTMLMNLKKPNQQQQKYAVRGQQIVWALQTLERKLHVQVTTEALCRMVRYLGDRGCMEDAYRIYTYARRIQPTHRASKSIFYLTMINAAIINNDTAKAERIWHEHLYRGSFSTHPVTPLFRPATLSAYNLLLNIYASQLPHPNLARVHRTYRRLLNAGHTPDTYTYNSLIKAFVNVGKPELAYQVYDTLTTTNTTTRNDKRAITMLLRGWIEKREWHRVEQFIRRLTDDGMQLDQRAFNVMLQGFLHLNGRIMTIEHLLKSHGDWTYWKHVHGNQPRYPLTSTDLWQLLYTVTGLSKQDFGGVVGANKSVGGGFAALFDGDGQGFNQVSCKLFIKAFTLAKDPHSAEMIKTWMLTSYPPILEKKPLL